MADDLKVRAIIELLLKGKGPEDAKKALAELQREVRAAKKGLGDLGGAGKGAGKQIRDGVNDAAKSTRSLADGVNALTRRLLGFGALIRVWRLFTQSTAEWAQKTREGREESRKLDTQWALIKDRIGELGARVLPALTAAFGGVIKSAQSLGVGFGIFFSGVIEGAKAAGEVLANAFNLKRLISQGPTEYLAGLADAAQRGVASIKAVAEGAQLELKQIWKKGTFDTAEEMSEFWQKAQEEQDAEIAKGLEEIQDRRRKAAEDELRDAKKLAEDRAAFEEKSQDDLLRAELAATAEGSGARLAAEIKLLERTRDKALAEAEKLKLSKLVIEQTFLLARQALIDEFDAKATEETKKTQKERDEDEKKRREALAEALYEGLRESLEADLELEDEAGQKRLQIQLDLLELERKQKIAEAKKLGADIERIEETYRKRKIAAERQNAEEEKRIARETARAKQEAALAVADQAVALAQALFGHNKAVAVAETVVYTARGIMSALSMFPPNIPLAALIAATGAVQIRNIISAKPGGAGGIGGSSTQTPAGQSTTGPGKPGGQPHPGGFDDPVSDRLAFRMGRKWAADFVAHNDRGFREGLAEAGVGPAASTTNNNQQTVTYDLRGAIADQRSLARFMRRARRAEANDRARRQR